MSKSLDIDKLLDVYCEGIYAMDPKTALPFWDYDFAPLFSDLWIKKMLGATGKARQLGLTTDEISHCFDNIAVPRKEIIYSLFDLKAGGVSKKDRLDYVNFWWGVVTQQCQRDCLVERANIIHTDDKIEQYLNMLPWQKSDKVRARQVGNLAMNLNSLAYGLYTDIFAHNSMENFGAYDVSKYFDNKKHILVIKQWANLKPFELYPQFADFPYTKINIYAVYKDIDYTVDIYTHQIYSGNAAENLVQYCITADDSFDLNMVQSLQEFNEALGPIVVNHYTSVRNRGFEEAKKSWVLARNYQFKKFFELVGFQWYDEEMLDRVKGKPLEQTDFWNFEGHTKETLFTFWKQAFDPRLDTIYKDWPRLFKKVEEQYAQ